MSEILKKLRVIISCINQDLLMMEHEHGTGSTNLLRWRTRRGFDEPTPSCIVVSVSGNSCFGWPTGRTGLAEGRCRGRGRGRRRPCPPARPLIALKKAMTAFAISGRAVIVSLHLLYEIMTIRTRVGVSFGNMIVFVIFFILIFLLLLKKFSIIGLCLSKSWLFAFDKFFDFQCQL